MPRNYALLEKATPNQTPPKSVIGRMYGVSGLVQNNGIIMEEFQKELQGQKAIKIYQEMSESDDTVGAALFAIEMTIRSVPWEVVVPAEHNGSAIHEERAQFVMGAFNDMDHTFEDFIMQVLSCIPYGFSLFEMVFKRRMGPYKREPYLNSQYSDGALGFQSLAFRSQDSIAKWEIQNDVLQGVWQSRPLSSFTASAPMGDIYIPMSQLLLFRSKYVKDNPEGRSALRNAYKSYYYKKHIENIEAIGIERDLNGLPLVRVPDELLQSDAAADIAVVNSYVEMARNVRFNHQAGVVLPSDVFMDGDQKLSQTRRVDFELVSAKGTRTIDTSAVIDRHSRGIVRSLLADWLMLGVGERGSQALSRDKSSNWRNALEGWLNAIEGVLNRRAIPSLYLVNGWPMEQLVRLQYGKVAEENIAELADSIEKLAGAGMPLFPDDDLEEHIRRRASWPDKNPAADYTTPADLEREKMDAAASVVSTNGNSQ